MAELYEKELFIFNQVPVRIFNHAFERENIFTPLHWHRNIEFNLTTGGRIRYMIDGCESEEHPGDWNVVNSGELHSNHWIGREDIFTGVSVQISKSFMDTWMGEKARFCLPEEKSRRERGSDPDQVRRTEKKTGEQQKCRRPRGDGAGLSLPAFSAGVLYCPGRREKFFRFKASGKYQEDHQLSGPALYGKCNADRRGGRISLYARPSFPDVPGADRLQFP